MYCSKCGKPLQAGAEFCPHCGARLEAPSREPLQRERFPKLPGVLLSIGVGLTLLIFLISWSVYGRVYFFDGYAITGIGWSLSFGLSAAGILLAVIFLAKGGPYGNLRRQLALLGALVAILAVVLLCSAFLNGAGSGSSSDVSSSDFAQNPYESCHSTQEHIQAIYSYDLNHDNYLSESELELFAEAHPRFINDEPFLAWAENHLG